MGLPDSTMFHFKCATLQASSQLQQHNCALPDANDLALRAQNFKIADLPMAMIWLCARKNSKLQTPDAAHQLHEHKNPNFVLEKPKNGGPEGQKRTKTSILCSGSPKTRVPEAKKAQKPQFCARNARKQGFRRVKAHKNFDFVLEMPEKGGSEG